MAHTDRSFGVLLRLVFDEVEANLKGQTRTRELVVRNMTDSLEAWGFLSADKYCVWGDGRDRKEATLEVLETDPIVRAALELLHQERALAPFKLALILALQGKSEEPSLHPPVMGWD